MTKTSLTWRKRDNQIQETQRISIRMNLNISTLRHIIIKLSNVKDKERILKQQEKTTCYVQRN